MKSLEEFYQEVQNNEELKKSFVTAFKEGQTEEFLKAHDCGATVSDVLDFLKGARDGAATEDDLAKVAGGLCSSMTCDHTCGCSSFAGKKIGLCQ